MRRINVRDFRVASNLTPREVNRRIILNVIRTRQPVSRADVARITGLQRSTVSLIVDQLITQGWIIEGALGHLPRGRRPVFLQLNIAQSRIIGVALRPSATVIGVADLNGHFLRQETISTPQNPKQFVTLLCERVKAIIAGTPDVRFEGIGVSTPGRVDSNTQRLIFAPNLGWHDVELKQPLQEATKLEVEVDNAANACAVAEMYFEKYTDGVDYLVSVAVAEGIGTGIVANGHLLSGPEGRAGEFGHTTIEPDGLLCRCGNHGCWEMYASNNAALRYYSELHGSTRRTAKRSSTTNVTFGDLLRLAGQGDPSARRALEGMAEYLGIGIANLVTGFTPGLISVTGELTQAWDLIGPIVQKVVEQRTVPPLHTKIMATNEAINPRLRGAVALVMQKHFGAPRVG